MFCISVYLSNLLTPYAHARTVHLQEKHLLAVPTVSTVIGRQIFSYAALSIWNEIPVEIRNNPLLSSFLRNIVRHIISFVPSLSVTTPSSSIVTAHVSDLAVAVNYVHV